jgi:hypothetical protein
MNSTLNNTIVSQSNIKAQIFSDISFIILIIGLITNLLCIIVFSIINRTFKTNGQMYKYLLMKAISDFSFFITYAINVFYGLSSDQMRNSFILQFCYIYLYHFFILIIELYSVYFEVLATIDCYLSIENKHKQFLTTKVFKLSSTFVIVFFFVFYSGKIFVYKILKNNNDEYYHVKTPLYYSLFYRTLSLLQLFFRDILGLFLCILFNILIFLSIKKMSEKKKLLSNNLALIKSIEAQENKVKMIYVSTLSHILLHFANFIYDAYGKYIKTTFWTDFSKISFLILTLSYITPFFIYILFNNKFREYFFKLIRIIFPIF